MATCLEQLELIPEFSATEIVERTRRTGLLPFAWETVGFSADERTAVAHAFMAGSRDRYEKLAAAEIEAFGRRGWPFRWLQRWQPTTVADRALAETIEEALHVIDQYYSRIVERGLAHSEDMGLLQAKGRGGSEGVAVKREAYGRNVLVSVGFVA